MNSALTQQRFDYHCKVIPAATILIDNSATWDAPLLYLAKRQGIAQRQEICQYSLFGTVQNHHRF
jgi:hypothetical protein